MDRLTEALAGEDFYEGDNPLADGNESGDDLEYSSDEDPDVQKGRSVNNLAATCDFQLCSILTIVDSYNPVQPPFKLRNSK